MAIKDVNEQLVDNTTYPEEKQAPDQIAESAIEPNDFATEIVDLPSKGLLYPEGHPLRTGKVEMKYMTTKEEDILSTTSYIREGIVLDKLFQSMLVTKFNYDDLLLGDRNAVMIAARIYGYGPNYKTKVINSSGAEQPVEVDLLNIKHKEFNVDSGYNKQTGTFTFELPQSKSVVEFKLLTVGMQKVIDEAIHKLKLHASKGEAEPNLTTRLRYMIVSVNGDTNRGNINKFIINMRAFDSRALREYIGKIQPDVDLQIEVVDESTRKPFRPEISLGLDLFWPDYKG